jgi:hypothetical protein
MFRGRCHALKGGGHLSRDDDRRKCGSGQN